MCRCVHVLCRGSTVETDPLLGCLPVTVRTAECACHRPCVLPRLFPPSLPPSLQGPGFTSFWLAGHQSGQNTGEGGEGNAGADPQGKVGGDSCLSPMREKKWVVFQCIYFVTSTSSPVYTHIHTYSVCRPVLCTVCTVYTCVYQYAMVEWYVQVCVE